MPCRISEKIVRCRRGTTTPITCPRPRRSARAIAKAICYSFNGSPTQLILIANIATSIATPIGGLFVLLLIWRKDANEGYKAPTALRICMTISYIFVLIMTVSAFQKTIIPGIMKLFA